ncbi:FKBP-type peptidyl-prolyl cis-trans isomerase [Sphingobacterium sp. SYP-B4668]|uniref:FKBP-type peptidyl-prolyl cis-trans isomerase n=1 Tax=Sphingobacterium sp. SYP-B4668 TaxID=2996035 RepID=UPI0022DD026E|nr:FKBP-type peptidyl-prolyl cis-trans isomerase [Sphingobacterium sp. SYP-B4668]
MRIKIAHYILLLIVTAFSLSSCSDNGDFFDPKQRFEEEKPIIKAYVDQHIPEAILDTNLGIWYEIISPGTPGSYIYKVEDTQNAKVIEANTKVKYSVTLMNGTVVEKNDTGIEFMVAANLNTGAKSVISAWLYAFFPAKIGEYNLGGLTINGLQKGAKIRFVTPSLHAYGHQAVGKIPSDSPLDFTIEVLDIKE